MNRIRVAICSGILLIALASQGSAQQIVNVRAHMVRLVPPDVALCLTIDDLSGLGDRTIDPRWIKAIRELPFGKALGDAPDLLQLDAVKAYVQAQLGLEWSELGTKLGADGLAFAYRPGPQAQPEQEAGLLLVHVKNQATLDDLMARLAAKPASEGKPAVLKDYKGLSYLQRKLGKADQYYFVDGLVLAFSTQEAMIQSAMECRANVRYVPPHSLARRNEVGTHILAGVWLNPRAFEEPLRAEAEKLGSSPKGRSLKAFLGYWKALDGVFLAVRGEKNLELTVALHGRAEQMPAAARKTLQAAIHPSDCWKRFPADSIAIVAGQSDFRSLLEAFDDLPAEDGADLIGLMQKSLGLPLSREFLQALAPTLGPDWGYCITAPQTKADFPHVIMALKVRTTAGRPEEVIGALNSVHLMTAIAMADYNHGHADQVKLHTLKSYQGDIHYLVNDEKYPKGFRPCFALRENYLVLASAPEAIEKFKLQSTEIVKGFGPNKSGTFKPAAMGIKTAIKSPESYPIVTTPLARVSSLRLAELMKDRREAMLHLMSKHRMPQQRKDVEARFQDLTTALSLFEQIDFVQQTQGDWVTWIVRVQTSPSKN